MAAQPPPPLHLCLSSHAGGGGDRRVRSFECSAAFAHDKFTTDQKPAAGPISQSPHARPPARPPARSTALTFNHRDTISE
ncbi:hypothetical protein NHJ13734_000247 [Beauveria thailandica]